ncbi:hypothetical protein CSHISOI_07342 [Colletotrichum shisoi]|uniref:Uncharacterized protein n=1 Tax=Colletotrichum shisoi TaxID=2078593 RepID=A0A5Q4BM97_9PEZI|nr:hypothetical protein CSHISOI_07342 [Colletotrichum shisoi]
MEAQDRAQRPITTRRAHVPTKSPAVGPSSRPDFGSQRSVTVRKICQDPLRCLNGPGLHSHLVQVPRAPQQAASASSSTTKQGGPILKRTRPELLRAEVSVEKSVRARDEQQQQQQQQQLRDKPQSESVAMPAEPPAEAVCAPSRPGHDGRSGERKPPRDEGAVKKTEDPSMKTLADLVSELKRDREQRAADARAERAPTAREKKKPELRLNMLTGREDTAKIPVDGNIQRVAQLSPAYISPNLLSGASLGGQCHAYGQAYNHWHPVNGIAAGSSTVFSQPLTTASARLPVLCAVPLCVQQAVSGLPPFLADVSAGGRDDPMCVLHYQLRAESELRMQELRQSDLERKREEEKEKQPERPRQPEKADAFTWNIQAEYRDLLDKLVRWQISTKGVQVIKDELGRLTIAPTASATAPEAETGKGPSELDAVDTEIRPGANEAGKARKAGEAGRGPKTSSTDPDGAPSEYTQRWVTDPVRAAGGKDVSGYERHPYSGCDSSSSGAKSTAPAPGKPATPPVEPTTTLSALLTDAEKAPPSDRRPGNGGAGEVASLALPASGGDEHRPWVQQSDVRKRSEERKRNKARKRDEAKAKEEARIEAQSLAFDVVDASEGDNPGDEYVEVAACESGREDDGADMCNVSRKEIPEMARTSTAAMEAATLTGEDFVLL